MNSFLILLFIVLFQTASGEITVTLLDTGETRVVGETIQFITQEQAVMASCVTNISGRCTMTINAPSDASGFIRGALAISGRGQRPVIWPGGGLELTLTLNDAGQLKIPSDLYVTRTPQNTPVEITPETTPEITPETTAETTPETTAEATTTSTPTIISLVTPTSSSTTSPETPTDFKFWWQLGLITILIAALIIYIWSSHRQGEL